MIYLDNAASTYKKPFSVKLKTLILLYKYTANPTRSGHKFSLRVGELVFKTRQTIANTFNCEIENVIFTSGCTEAINLGIIGCKQPNGHIITTCFEHNAVLRSLEYLKKHFNINYTILYPKIENDIITIEQFENAITNKTYMIITNHVSNVVGVEQNIYNIGLLCEKHNLIYMVDGAQSAGHKKIDMAYYHINLLTIAGHKGILGLQGAGVLCINGNVNILPIKYGGTGTDTTSFDQPIIRPEGFESGTLPTPSIISMQYGIKHAYKHLIKYNKKIEFLSKYLYANIKNDNNIKIYYPEHIKNGVISINIKGYSSAEISNYLDEKYGIATRSGLHCAPLIHKFLKTDKEGTVRISISHTNTKKDIKCLINALNKLKTK